VYELRATASAVRFPGFRALYEEQTDQPSEDDAQTLSSPLPEMNAGDRLTLRGFTKEQHFTEPPPRYTEASLVKALEENGIGRPSTYAPIMGTIQDRGYVERDARRLKPTELGTTVNDVLVKQFEDIMDPDFTANLEDKLDEVAQG